MSKKTCSDASATQNEMFRVRETLDYQKKFLRTNFHEFCSGNSIKNAAAEFRGQRAFNFTLQDSQKFYVQIVKMVALEGADISKELKKVNLKHVEIVLSKTWENVKPDLPSKCLDVNFQHNLMIIFANTINLSRNSHSLSSKLDAQALIMPLTLHYYICNIVL